MQKKKERKGESINGRGEWGRYLYLLYTYFYDARKRGRREKKRGKVMLKSEEKKREGKTLTLCSIITCLSTRDRGREKGRRVGERKKKRPEKPLPVFFFSKHLGRERGRRGRKMDEKVKMKWKGGRRNEK